MLLSKPLIQGTVFSVGTPYISEAARRYEQRIASNLSVGENAREEVKRSRRKWNAVLCK
jgi:hypothetical protein